MNFISRQGLSLVKQVVKSKPYLCRFHTGIISNMPIKVSEISKKAKNCFQKQVGFFKKNVIRWEGFKSRDQTLGCANFLSIKNGG